MNHIKNALIVDTILLIILIIQLHLNSFMLIKLKNSYSNYMIINKIFKQKYLNNQFF